MLKSWFGAKSCDVLFEPPAPSCLSIAWGNDRQAGLRAEFRIMGPHLGNCHWCYTNGQESAKEWLGNVVTRVGSDVTLHYIKCPYVKIFKGT